MKLISKQRKDNLQTVASYACICSSECLTCGRCNAQYALLVQLRDNAVSETINNPIVDLQLLFVSDFMSCHQIAHIS